MLRVTYCCCGCSLKIGTLLIILFNMFMSWIFVTVTKALRELGFDLPNYYILGALLEIFTGIPGLIGVFAEIHILLLPYLGWQVLNLIWYVIIMICAPFTIGAAIPTTENTFSETVGGLIYGSDAVNKRYITSEDVVRTEFRYALTFLLTFYFFIVILSHYYELKENRSSGYGGGFQASMKFGGPYRPYPPVSPREDGSQNEE